MAMLGGEEEGEPAQTSRVRLYMAVLEKFDAPLLSTAYVR